MFRHPIPRINLGVNVRSVLLLRTLILSSPSVRPRFGRRIYPNYCASFTWNRASKNIRSNTQTRPSALIFDS